MRPTGTEDCASIGRNLKPSQQMLLKLCVERIEALIPDGDQATLNSLTEPAQQQTRRKRALGRKKTYCRDSEVPMIN